MKGKRTYTIRIHKDRLRKMLKREHPCGCCPAARRFDAARSTIELWSEDTWPCNVCRAFIGLEGPAPACSLNRCPCHALSKGEALERSFKALKGEKP